MLIHIYLRQVKKKFHDTSLRYFKTKKAKLFKENSNIIFVLTPNMITIKINY